MVDWIKKSARAFSEKGGIVTILLVKLFGVYYVYATFTGSVCGGIVNCIINYKWTFKSKECKKRHVIVKYLLVWIGSILLNTWGIYFMTETISRNPWVQETLKHCLSDFFGTIICNVSLSTRTVGSGTVFRKRTQNKNKIVIYEIQSF